MSKAAEKSPSISSVAVIGAGPCGLATAKYLLAEKKFTKVRVIEQRESVGGVWVYTPLNVVDSGFAVPNTKPAKIPDTAVCVEGHVAPQFVSPVYDMLDTNIPHTLMNYMDKEFPAGAPLFPPHTMVKEYLEGYAAELASVLSLSTQVLDVKKIQPQDGAVPYWLVDTLDLITGATRSEAFDAVVVASGHYSVPFIPDISGLADFNKAYPQTISHSKFYRNPAEYKDKKVIIVGKSASGIDLSAQIATVCKAPIYVSEKTVSESSAEDEPSMKMMPEIKEFHAKDKSVEFSDGQVVSGVDAVVFCTGYLYSYPFLSSLSPPVVTDGSCAHRLYQHVLYSDDPTLAFVGIPLRIVPFPVSQAQAAWIARIWSGRLPVPATSTMNAWESQLLQDRGGGKAIHDMGFPLDVQYINLLHELSMQAEKRPELFSNDGVGKMPPYWDEEAAWVRERFPLIKEASKKLGPKRHLVTTIAELGFDYKAWKTTKAEGEKNSQDRI